MFHNIRLSKALSLTPCVLALALNLNACSCNNTQTSPADAALDTALDASNDSPNQFRDQGVDAADSSQDDAKVDSSLDGSVQLRCEAATPIAPNLDFDALRENMRTRLSTMGVNPSIDGFANYVSLSGFRKSFANVDAVDRDARALLFVCDAVGLTPSQCSDFSALDASQEAMQRVILRSSVGGRPAKFEAAAFTYLWDGSDLVMITVDFAPVHMSSAQADLLHECGELQGVTLAPFVFRGNEFDACTMIREYEYAWNAADRFQITGAPKWIWHEGQWRVVRSGELEIDRSNYWPNIGASDVACPGRSGYEVVIDNVRGEVLRYTPGLGCHVC